MDGIGFTGVFRPLQMAVLKVGGVKQRCGATGRLLGYVVFQEDELFMSNHMKIVLHQLFA